MKPIKKQLSLVLLTIVLLVPAIHKLTDQIPPEWFIGKFQDSFIGQIPGGITLSYGIIIILELIGPVFFILGLIQMLMKKNHRHLVSKGFLICYILFLVLAFGSFLVQDYDNGFKDFLYFVGVAVLEYFYFSGEENQPSN